MHMGSLVPFLLLRQGTWTKLFYVYLCQLAIAVGQHTPNLVAYAEYDLFSS